MKKFGSYIVVILLALGFALLWNLADKRDPERLMYEEFGASVYQDEYGSVRARPMDDCEKGDEQLYQLYVCWYDPNNGALKDYQKLGVYEESRLFEGIDHAIEFYQESGSF